MSFGNSAESRVGLESRLAPPSSATRLPHVSLSALLNVADESDDDLLGGEELPDAGEDITFSNISMTSFSAELAVDRRKTSVLERMSSAVTADSERGRRRRTINGSTDEAENASAVGNILPPSLVGKPSILQESGKTNFPVEKMAALDISAARSGPASPVAKGAPASPVATTPRSSTFSFARSFAERNSALAAESAGTPGAVVSKMPEEHSYTARAASRSRSRSRSVPRSPGHHDTELHQSSETAVAVQFFALDAESVLDEPAHAASPTSSRISAALPEVKRERLGDQEFQMEAEGQEQSLFVDAQMGLEDEPMPPFGSPAALSEAAPPSAATTGEVAATVQTPTTSRSKPTLSEFDPLIAFESPVGGASAAGAPAVAKASTGFSILEMFTGNIGTPTSTFKYSQKDVDGMKATLKAEHDKEIADLTSSHEETLAASLGALQLEFEARQKPLVAELDKMRRLVNDYEQIMESYIQEKQNMVESFDKKIETAEEEHKEQLRKAEQLAKDERIKMKAEYLAREEDYQKDQEQLKKQVEALEKDKLGLQHKYDRLKKHAEDKLDGANVEIARVKAAYEKELLAMKSKLTKCESQLKSTQASLDLKTKENEELTNLCDELVAQLEGAQK